MRKRARTGLTAAVAAVAATAWLAAPAAQGAETLWWANFSGAKVSFANLDGTGAGGDLNTTGATAPGFVAGVALDPAAGRAYWANASTNKISYANLDGSGGGGDLNTTGASVVAPRGLAINPAAGRVYWGNAGGGGSISYANLNGSGGGNLDTTGATVSFPWGVAIDPAANRIYWANFDLASTNEISYANLDGSGGGADLVTTGATVAQPKGVAIDKAAGRIYWVNAGAGSAATKVSYASLAGGGGGDLTITGATGTGNVSGPALDVNANRIYWTSGDLNKLSFANLDGTGSGGDVNTTGATNNEPTFAAILRAPSPNGAPAVSGGATTGSSLSCSQGTWRADDIGALLYRAPRTFSYQWTLNGSDIAGATGSTHTAAAPGAYACKVAATNAAGTGGPQASAAHQVADPPPVAPKRCKKGRKLKRGKCVKKKRKKR